MTNCEVGLGTAVSVSAEQLDCLLLRSGWYDFDSCVWKLVGLASWLIE